MNIKITVSNVSRDWIPDGTVLRSLLRLVETSYKSKVTFVFEIATEFTCDDRQRVVPVGRIVVTVKDEIPAASFGEHRSNNFAAKAEEIKNRIQTLLLASHPETLNLPAIVTIFAYGSHYDFENVALWKRLPSR